MQLARAGRLHRAVRGGAPDDRCSQTGRGWFGGGWRRRPVSHESSFYFVSTSMDVDPADPPGDDFRQLDVRPNAVAVLVLE